jgi:hypothetical protein
MSFGHRLGRQGEGTGVGSMLIGGWLGRTTESVARRSALGWCAVMLVMACGTGAAWAAPLPLLTILDGEAVLRIGTGSAAAAEGLRLPEGTLVETNAQTKLLRLEWADGSVLDLGPDTRLMVLPGAAVRAGTAAPAFYLLQGWAKQVGAPGEAHRGGVTALVDVLPGTGIVVLHADAALAWVFAEAGDAHLADRGAAGGRVNLVAGSAYLRQGQARGDLAARPHPDQLKQVPRGFRDSIGPRAASFKGRPEPKAVARPAPDYAALKPWLTAEPALRRDFAKRFAPLLREPAFRAAVQANMNFHPEWEPVLHPPLPNATTVKPPETKR